MDDGGVAEADVDGGRAADPVERPLERRHPVLPRLLRAGLEIGLVDLHHVRPCVEQVADLLVHGRRVRQRSARVIGIMLVLRLLGHRERPGHGHLDGPIRVAAQEAHVLDLHGVPPADRADDPRHRVGVTAPVERRPRVVDVDPGERGGEPVGVALTPHLAVGDDVQPGVLLGPDRQQRRVILGLLQIRLVDSPQLTRPDAWREPSRQLASIDQPLGLGVAADEHRGKERWLHTASKDGRPP